MRADRPVIAAVDQGSTRTKGALFGAGGHRLREASAAVEAQIDGPRVELDPEGLLAGVREVLAELLRGAGPIDAVGLACQRSTCLVWERTSGRPLTAAISWQDRREAAAVAALAAHAADLPARTGLRLSPHYAAPKLRRLLGEVGRDPRELVAGTLDAFLVHRLTGLPSTEAGHAGRTLLYNLEAASWDDELCRFFGVPREVLPPLLPAAGPRGEVEGIPLTALAGDQQAALLGQGGWRPGVVAVHLGTGAFVLASTGAAAVRHPGLLTAVLAATAGATRFQLEAPVNSAGSAVDWAARLTGERLESWAGRPLDPDTLPRVLPSFTGAAAPWWRPEARAVVAGLGLETGGAELFGGVLAGVAMRIADGIEALREAGLEIRSLRSSGALSRLEGLAGLLSDASGSEVAVSEEEEMGLAGIARLAAAGLTGEERPLACEPPTRRRYEPRWDAERREQAREAWRAFARRALELQG